MGGKAILLVYVCRLRGGYPYYSQWLVVFAAAAQVVNDPRSLTCLLSGAFPPSPQLAKQVVF